MIFFEAVTMADFDPFFLSAVATSTATAFGIAAITGLPFRYGRKQHGPSSNTL
jgi:hypothetical protein